MTWANEFVGANMALLREHGFLELAVPAELGGAGLSRTELSAMLRELAHLCGSTALALAMHPMWLPPPPGAGATRRRRPTACSSASLPNASSSCRPAAPIGSWDPARRSRSTAATGSTHARCSRAARRPPTCS